MDTSGWRRLQQLVPQNRWRIRQVVRRYLKIEALRKKGDIRSKHRDSGKRGPTIHVGGAHTNSPLQGAHASAAALVKREGKTPSARQRTPGPWALQPTSAKQQLETPMCTSGCAVPWYLLLRRAHSHLRHVPPHAGPNPLAMPINTFQRPASTSPTPDPNPDPSLTSAPATHPRTYPLHPTLSPHPPACPLRPAHSVPR